jgi:hypothetical protein
MADTPSTAHLVAVCLFATQLQYLEIFFPFHGSLNLKIESLQVDDVVGEACGATVGEACGAAVGLAFGFAVGAGFREQSE